MLDCTSAEITSRPLCLSNTSDNILVTDHFFQDTVTRELVNISSNSSTASCYHLIFPHLLSYSTFSNPGNHLILPNSFVHVIIAPPKIWSPKTETRYKSIAYTDVDDDCYVLHTYGKTMARSCKWKACPRIEFIL